MRGHNYLPATFSSTGVINERHIGGVIPVRTYGSFRVDLVAEVTVVGAITAYLQGSPDGSTWANTKNVSLVDGVNTFKFVESVAGDQTYLPLPAYLRVVVTTTNADDVVTITKLTA